LPGKPAKRLIGLRVVSYHHKRIPLWRAVLRYLGYYISALPFGLGFLWILIDDRRMAWHDKLAGTCVLYAWDAQPDETFLVRVTQLLTSRQAAMEELRKQRRRLSSFLHKDEKNKISSDAVLFFSSAPEESQDTEEDLDDLQSLISKFGIVQPDRFDSAIIYNQTMYPQYPPSLKNGSRLKTGNLL
jgi:hypothetical protein